MVAARNAQPPIATSTGSDQEREKLQEKTASLQSDDEEDVAVNSAPSSDTCTHDDSDVLRESELYDG